MKSVDAQEVNTVVEEEGENWMTPIIRCLEEGIWPEDEKEARNLWMKISQYVVEEGALCKKSYLGSMLRCAGPLQATYVIREVHKEHVECAPDLDGVSSLKGVGAGLMLIDLTDVEYTYTIQLNFPSTNNEAEYEALLAGLKIAQKMKVQGLKAEVDSKLVACQLNGEFIASSEGMT
nr:ribonuclease H-like domain-containing protein [Tanacetum cinerariifolium]